MSTFAIVNGRVRRVTSLPTLQTGKKTWAAQAVGLFLLKEDGAGTVSATAGTPMEAAFYLDPADTPNLRLRCIVAANSVASGSTFTFSLVPVSSGSGDGAGAVGVTVGAAITGSTAAVTAPAVDTLQKVDVSFSCPAAGFYAVQLQISVAAMAASSAVTTRFILQEPRT